MLVGNGYPDHRMGICVHCGKSAGFLRKSHAECAAKASAAAEQAAAAQAASKRAISQALIGYVTTDLPIDRLVAVVEHERAAAGTSEIDAKRSLIVGWQQAVNTALEDGVLSEDESQRLAQVSARFGLEQADLDGDGAYTRAAKAVVLRKVLAGQIPDNVTIEGVPVNLQRGEQPVWLFNRVKYLEDQERRQMVGASQGVSVRVMKGVYYRVGAFKGEPVVSTQRKHVDTGMLLVTTRNLYFVGPAKSMRIPHAKVVSFAPYSDAFGLTRDAATAKPQFFLVDDPWFAFNLVTNLAQMD